MPTFCDVQFIFSAVIFTELEALKVKYHFSKSSKIPQ